MTPTLIARAALGLAPVEFDHRDNQASIIDAGSRCGVSSRQPLTSRSTWSYELPPIGSEHPGAEPVEGLERCLVAARGKLTLVLDDRHAWHMGRNGVFGPEPDRQRRVGPLHDRAGRQRVIPLTISLQEKVWPVSKRQGLPGSCHPHEPVALADAFKVSGSILIVTKEPLELWDRTGKIQIRMRQHDGGHDGVAISPLQSPGVNPIKTELTMKLKS